MCKSAACAKLKCANAFCFQKKHEAPKKECTQTLHYVKLSYEAKQDCANVFCSICTTMRCAKRNGKLKILHGKSQCARAFCFCCFGKAIQDIKLMNLEKLGRANKFCFNGSTQFMKTKCIQKKYNMFSVPVCFVFLALMEQCTKSLCKAEACSKTKL